VFDVYHVLKFVHVYSVIIWLGSGIAFTIIAGRVRASGSPEDMASLVDRLEWFGKVIYPPLSIVVLLTGIVRLTTIKTLIAQQGAGSAEVQRNVDQLLVLARIDLVILTLIVADMVLKPGS
jgi:hypothetical protein